MSKKKFNRRKCPYKQLARHKGAALVTVTRRSGTFNRIRYVSRSKFIPRDNYYLDSDKAYAFHSGCYVNFNIDGELIGAIAVHRSCFSSSHSYKRTIEDMKEYDRQMGLCISHIDFF